MVFSLNTAKDVLTVKVEGLDPIVIAKDAKIIDGNPKAVAKMLDAIDKDPTLLTADVRAILGDKAVSEALSADANRIAKLQAAIHFKPGANAIETQGKLLNNEFARKMRSSDDLMTHLSLSKEQITQLDSLIKEKTVLKGLMDAEPRVAKDIDAFLRKHHELDGKLKTALFKDIGAHGELAGLADALAGKITSTAEGVLKHAGDLEKLEGQLKDAKGAAKTTIEGQIKTASDELKKLEAEPHYGNALKQLEKGDEASKNAAEYVQTHKEFGAKAKSALTSVGSATEAAKTGEAKFFSLFKGETELAELAKKDGKAVSELGFLKKLRPGKTAVVAGVAALGAYFIAGIGNKGPSERAEAVSKGRENEPVARGA